MCEAAATKKIARPSICFVEDDQKEEVIQIFKDKYKITDYLDVKKVS